MINTWYEQVIKYMNERGLNSITAEQAIGPECVNLKIFDAPLKGCADPSDALFPQLKSEVIGQHFRLPLQWVSNAQTVISMFFPFSMEVVKSNNRDKNDPSEMWLHGRVEGHKCLNDIAKFMVNLFEAAGYTTICPGLSDDFFAVQKGGELNFTSNWSERHVAYVCGLGTFGLSKGLITEKGMAGRFLSIITQANLEKTPLKYNSTYEHCTMCGVCVKACPVKAISLEQGKNHIICSDFLDLTKEKFKPRYGCGKCQTMVPCARRIPNKIKAAELRG